MDQKTKQVDTAPKEIALYSYTELVDALYRYVLSSDLLQERLDKGDYLKKQDGQWWLFDKDGEGIASGKNIRDLALSLIEEA